MRSWRRVRGPKAGAESSREISRVREVRPTFHGTNAKGTPGVSAEGLELRAYCELGQLLDETRQAVEYNDTNAIAAVTAKTDAFERQLGPEYDKVLNGLDQIDFSSDEGKRIAEVFGSLQRSAKKKRKNSGNTHGTDTRGDSHTGVNTQPMMTLGKAGATRAAAEK